MEEGVEGGLGKDGFREGGEGEGGGVRGWWRARRVSGWGGEGGGELGDGLKGSFERVERGV